MARLVTSGAEFRHAATTGNDQAEGGGYTATGVTIETTVVRSGGAAWKAAAHSSYASWAFTTSDANDYFVRGYFRWPSAPVVEQTIISAAPSAQATVRVLAGTTQVALFDDANVQVGSASGTLALDTWHRIEMTVGITSGRLKLYVDGALIAGVDSGADLSTTITSFRVGSASTVASTDVVYFDDVAINDSTGGVDDGLPGPGKIVLLLANSDYQRDANWANSANGTTNLYDEVNNTPPSAVVSTPANYIYNIVSTTTETYTAETTTYASAGITAVDRIKIVRGLAIIGDVTAGATRSTGLKLDNNPSDTEVTANTPTGAIGTYPTNWITMRGSLNTSPSVTITDPVRVRVRKNSANADQLNVALMGVYVEYGPPTLVTLTPATETDVAQGITFRNAIDVTATAATETDAAQGLAARKQATLSTATETDGAQALSVTHVHYRTITPATESDQAQALDADKRASLALASETDVAQPPSVTKTIYKVLTPATEADAAQALSITRNIYRTLTPASEVDAAQDLSIQGAAQPALGGYATVSVRRRLREPQVALVLPAHEVDTAVPLTFVKTPSRIQIEDDELLLLS